MRVGQAVFGRRFFSAQAAQVKETQPEVNDLFEEGLSQKPVGAACELVPLAGGVLPTACLMFAVESTDGSQTPEKLVELGPALRRQDGDGRLAECGVVCWRSVRGLSRCRWAGWCSLKLTLLIRIGLVR